MIEARPLRRQIFSLLALVFFLTSLCVAVAVAGFMALHRPPAGAHATLHRNLVYHFVGLAQRIGQPPDLAEAASLARGLNLKLRIRGPHLAWDSEPGLPAWQEFVPRPGPPPGESEDEADDPPAVQTGQIRGYWATQVSQGGQQCLFLLPGGPDSGISTGKVAFLIGLILLILVVSWLSVRMLLRPFNLLVAGVGALSSGNLDYRIDTGRRNDEFRSLAEAFNLMAGRVREMVQARERLLLDVSHELRSPLTRLKLALEMSPNTAGRQAAAKAADNMGRLVTSLLETERLKSGKGALRQSKVSLPAVAARVARTLRGAEPGLRLARPKAFPQVLADAERVEMAIKNLIENGLKYSAQQSRPVEVEFSHGPGWAEVAVRDHGVGIPQEDQPYVFDAFYRVDPSRAKHTGGYGLGLSLCREVARAHGGSISLKSAPGAGTCVTLRLPLTPPIEEAP
jgi:signal transduction histidine kinase